MVHTRWRDKWASGLPQGDEKSEQALPRGARTKGILKTPHRIRSTPLQQLHQNWHLRPIWRAAHLPRRVDVIYFPVFLSRYSANR